MNANSGKHAKSTYRWLIKQARSPRRWVLLSIGSGYAGGLLIITQAYLLAEVIHGAIIARQPSQVFWPTLAVLAVIVLLRAAAGWCREVSGFLTGAAVRREVRRELMMHLFTLGPAYQSNQHSGALATTAVEQVEALHDFFAFYLPQLALATAIPISIVAVIFPINWAVGALLLLTAPLIPLFMYLIGMGVENISQRHFQSLARLSAHFLDTLQGLATLKVFDRSRNETANIEKTSRDYRRRTMAVLRVAFLSSAVLEFFSMVSIALVAVYLGLSFLHYIDFGSYGEPLTLATGLFILILAPEFYLPLRELGTHFHARAKALGAAEEILKILAVQPPTAMKPSGESKDMHLEPINISCRNLRLAYDSGSRPALRGVSLDIHAGQQIAIVGTSGCGKTTLLNLIMGFLAPDTGDILVGDTPLGQLSSDSWRSRISWLGQQPYLFHASIRENICLGRPLATESEVQQAAAAAHVLSFSQQLPRGLDTLVGEQGFGLSRGQAQRVALARTILKDAPLVLLDEPTAGLDIRSETLVLESLEHLGRIRTVIMATHRLTHIEKADRIYVMHNGAIAEKGNFQDLIRVGGRFRQMVQAGMDAGGVTP